MDLQQVDVRKILNDALGHFELPKQYQVVVPNKLPV